MPTEGKVDIVLGASGFIGTRLVKALSHQGRETWAIDIAEPRATYPSAHYHEADIRAPESVPVANAERIYNFAATHRTPGHEPHEYYETNVNGAIFATSLADRVGAKTIVFTSSISVYGPGEDVKTESSPPTPTSHYGRSKLMAERIHRQWLAKGGGRRLIIVRPGVVFGPGERGNYSHLASAIRRGVFFFPGRRDTIKSGGYVDELISTMQFCLDRPESEITYNFCYPDEYSISGIVSTIARSMGKSYAAPTIPSFILKTAAIPFEIANQVGIKNPIHRERIEKLMFSTRIAPDWLMNSGYTFKSDLNSAIDSWNAETSGEFV